MKVFIFNGQGGSGKDTFENFLIKEIKKDNKIEIKKNGLYLKKISMIDIIKALALFMNYDGSKDMRDRLFLNKLKMLFAEYNDSPYQKIKEDINYLKRNGCKILFIDAREPSDIERLKKDFKVITVLIKRGEPKYYGNCADDQVFNIDYDLIVDNNGTLEELEEKAKKIYNNYIKEN